MEYEGFLIVSYFLAAGMCAVIGWSAYACLRGPMRSLLGHLVPARTGNLLGWSFPLSTILVALAAFASVSYRGCDMSYHRIVSDRTLMLDRSREQITWALELVAIAVCFWVLVMSIVVIASRLQSSAETDGRGAHIADLPTRPD